MMDTGANIIVEEIRRYYEQQMYAHVSIIEAQARAELRTQQAVQECQHQTSAFEAKCEFMLANQDAQNQQRSYPRNQAASRCPHERGG